MKRPLEYIAGGFVLGEVLALLPVGWMAGILAAVTAGVFCLRKKTGGSLMWRLLPVFCAAGIIWMKEDGRSRREYERLAGQLSGSPAEARGTVKGIGEGKDGESLVLELGQVTLRSGEQEIKYGDLLVSVNQTGIRKREGESEPPALRIGGRVRVKGKLEPFKRAGNPGEFDYGSYYHALGLRGRFFGQVLETEGEGYSPYFDGLSRLKGHGTKVLDLVCAGEDRGIFRAVVLGEKTGLSDEVRRLYQRNGIAHLLAISGLHISMIGMGGYRLLRKAGLGIRAAGGMAMALTVSYGVMAAGTGISASITRAVVMVLLQITADCIGRTYDMITAACVSALLLLMKSPSLLFQAGFQLSFGAVLSLGMAVPAAERWLEVKSGAGKVLLAGAVIQVMTCPVILYHYFEYPVYGILLNLVVIPLMPCVLLAGIGGVVFGTWSVTAGQAAVGTGHYVLRLYRLLCETAQKLPGAVLITGRPKMWQLAAYAVIWGIMLTVMAWNGRRRSGDGKNQESDGKAEGGERQEGGEKRGRRLVMAAVTAGSLTVLMVSPPLKGMETTFLDVGQGDGICVRTADTVILTDGGSSDRKKLGEQVLEPFLKSQGINRIDYAIVSHGDMDHISGLMELLEKDTGIRVDNVILPWLGGAGEAGGEIYERLEQLAQNHGARVFRMKQGDKIKAGDLQIRCLYAGEEKTGRSGKEDRNEHSLLLQVNYGLAGILLTGDMSAEGERLWLRKGEQPQIQVLKAAHHGSSYSSCQEFLQQVDPMWTVISCGEGNRYGHPGPDMLERLEEQGSRWYITAEEGAVTVSTDGERIQMKGFR